MKRLELRRPSRKALALAAALLVLAGFVGIGMAKTRIETGIGSFLPGDDPAVTRFEELSRSFGGDPVVVLLEAEQPGLLLDQPHLPSLVKLEGEFTKLPDVAAVYGPGTVLNQAAGRAQDLMAELAGRRDRLRAQAQAQAKERGASDADAAKAADAALTGFDQRYGKLLVQALPAGLPTLKNQAFVNSVVFGADGNPRPQWHFVVPSAKAAAILVRPRQNLDQAGTERLVQGVRDAVDAARVDGAKVTVSGVPAIAGALADEVRAELPLLGGAALLAVALCFLLVPWHRRRRRLLPLAGSLAAAAVTVAVFGWLGRPLSLGVVAFLPVLLGVGSDFPTYLARRADRRVVFAVAAATAAAFGALAFAPLPFVRDLGIALGIGVLVAFAIGLSFRPAAVEPESAAVRSGRTTSLPVRLGVGLVVVGLAVGGWAMLPRLSLQSDIQSFVHGLPAFDDAKRVEQVIGSSGEVDVVLHGPDVTSPQALAWLRQAQDVAIARHGDSLRPVVSLPTLLNFLGPTPTKDEITAAIRLLPPYLTGSVLRADSRQTVLSFGVRLNDVEGLVALRDDLLRLLPPAPPGYHAELTGLPVVAARGYELVSGNRFWTNGLGIAVAGLVLAVVLARRKDALRAVATALLATGVGLLGIWMTGISLTPITMALGSLIAAVGCEFAVLLAEAERRRDHALRRSVLLVAAVSTAGYLVLSLSRLDAIRQFGLLLAAAVLLSIAAARLVVWLAPGRTRAGPGSETTPASDPLVGVTS
ncbi:MMPL family transporter [Amycolatopsis sp. NPDC057786]|uniref:MMPL family transporter n=1 Tax=Amycolatopsis sp. NPDC057786 TaxID=3346250 RepID=UPI00366BC3EB